MSRFLHGVLQVLAVLTHIINVSAVPVHYQGVVAAGIGALQTILALANHTN